MPPSSSPPEPTTPLAYEVIQLLVAMGGRLTQNFTARAAEFDLSAAEAKVLLALEPGGALSMRALARQLGYDASNLTGIVDRLEDHGAVQRRADPTDRRVKTIVATDEGERLRGGLVRRLRADAGPVSALSETELHDLHTLLLHAMDDDHPT